MRLVLKQTLFFLILSLTFTGIALGYVKRIKTPSDVYSYAMTLKKKVEFLRKQAGITSPFPKVPVQKNKFPRHVIQKSLEILSKINLYRISKGWGEIFIPPYPARDITPSDVYDSVKRLDEEVTPFIKNKNFLNSLHFKKFTGKTPNDVYRLLWSISLAFDSLLGIHGYSPQDVFSLSEKLVETTKFLRESQNIYQEIGKPKKQEGLHPNHALYKSYDFLKKVSKAEKKLWIEPTEVPAKPKRVITLTEVYDSIQYNIAELQRIKYRLGLERYFKLKSVKGVKTPSDIVQNIQYAINLMPTFDFKRELIQYPQNSLKKTPNDVYAVTIEILNKLEKLKQLRGISKRAKIPPYIYGLKPIHTYQKGIEAIEKLIKLKTQMGFYPSQVPSPPLREITPSEVYELVLRLDGITTILLRKAGDKNADEYIYKIGKKVYTGKTPSDVYNNLWRISNLVDVLLAKEYSPNETFFMASRIQKKIKILLDKLKINKDINYKNILSIKTPADVFRLTLKLFDRIKRAQRRLNMQSANILIPEEKVITPNTVYNALRIVNAAINEIFIYLDIGEEGEIKSILPMPKGKTPTDVFNNVNYSLMLIKTLFNDSSYEKN